MGKPDAPEPTDPLGPLALGNAYNNPNQYTPFGNLIYSQPTLPHGTTADNLGNVPLNQIGQGSVDLQLPPELQGIYDTQTGITQESLNQAWDALQTMGQTGYNLPGSINIEDYQFADPTLGSYAEQRDAATQSEFDRQMALIDPVYERQEQSLRESLASRGIPTDRGYGTGQTVASDAAVRELDVQGDQYRQAVDQAAQQAITQGRQETALGIDYGRELFSQQNQQNTGNINLYGTALQQELGQMGFLQNMVAAPLGYQQVQVPNLGSFYGPTQQDVVGAFGAYDANQQSAYSSQMDLISSLYGAGGMLGGAWIGRG